MHPILAVMGGSLRFSGSLSKASSSSPVVSDTVTVIGNGTLLFASVVTDDGTPQYSLNGGAWTNITALGTLAVANGDTFAQRAPLGTVGFSSGVTIQNNATSLTIQEAVLERT